MNPVEFICNVCLGTEVGRTLTRGDGSHVFFCSICDMGVVENPPQSTDFFYADGYYEGQDGTNGYVDYELTAEHSLLWVRLLIEASVPPPARLLDVGCADGFLLDRISGEYKKFGIEVNQTAIARASKRGIVIVGNDLLADTISAETLGLFDAITSIATFEHVLDFKGAIGKCLDLLHDEGILLFEVPLISQTSDNTGWLNGSYEHIFYPTISGLERLYSDLPNVNHYGFETKIKGFSSTYVGVLTRSPSRFRTVKALMETMRSDNLTGLSNTERLLNISYTLVHDFNPTPERIKALPDLIYETGGSKTLLTHVCNLWASDNSVAGAADWHRQQASNWESAYKQALIMIDQLRSQIEILHKEEEPETRQEESGL